MSKSVKTVINRRGAEEPVDISKISNRIFKLANRAPALQNIDVFEVVRATLNQMVDRVETTVIDGFSAEICAAMCVKHIDYLTLAGRISISNHHRNTRNSFRDTTEILYRNKDEQGNYCPIVKEQYYKFICQNFEAIDKYIDYSRDYAYDYNAFLTLKKSYLLKVAGKTVERPQDLFMRTAIGLYHSLDDSGEHDAEALQKIFKVYDRLSNKYYMHATPTISNCGTIYGNYSSCFLLGLDDSLEGIMKNITDCAEISKRGGGIGIQMPLRAAGSHIRGTGGQSSGVVPFCRIWNAAARGFDQGGRRQGSFAVYMEMHHPDLMSFLALKRPGTDENMRAQDLFLALWVSDLFMERLVNDEIWSFFCPDRCPGLEKAYGAEYTALYLDYEQKGLYHGQIPAREIYMHIYQSIQEVGVPYICFKDNFNRSNMQNNLGTIRTSNLCAEISIYSDENEYGVCNLASICLPKCVEDTWTEQELLESPRRELNHEYPLHPKFNYKLLVELAGELVDNLNQVIDRNYNPVKEAIRSNFAHRPIAIGVQGLADVFFKFGVAFGSKEARDLNKKILEGIYFGALSRSTVIARELCEEMMARGQTHVDKYPEHVAHDLVDKLAGQAVSNLFPGEAPASVVKEIYSKFAEIVAAENRTNYDVLPKTAGAYSSYERGEGSNISNGKFHWEMVGLTEKDLSGLYEWESLREHIADWGVRNSLLCAAMPTASTSTITGCYPCFEPCSHNIFKRTGLSGSWPVINKYLMRDLMEAGIWSEDLANFIAMKGGSVQDINDPDGRLAQIKEVYKTAFEVRQVDILNLAIDRQPFIDQSQSMNVFMRDIDMVRLMKLHVHGWRNGLKTGSYYIHSRPAMNCQTYSLDVETEAKLLGGDVIGGSDRKPIVVSKGYDPHPDEIICTFCQ